MALLHRRHEDLADRLERKGSELSQMAAEKGTESSRRVADILRRASDEIRDSELGSYRDRVMDAMDSAHEHLEGHMEHARDNIREHPLAVVAVAAGLGLLAGAAIGAIGAHTAHEYMD